MEEVVGEVRSSRQLLRKVREGPKRPRCARTLESCMSGSSYSRQVSGIRAAAARNRAAASEGRNTHDKGSGDVVDGVPDAISVSNEAEKSDAQRQYEDEVRIDARTR